MTSPTIIVLALAAPLTIIGLAVFVWRAARRLRAAYTDAVTSYQRLEPSIQQLQRDAEVARREVDGLGAALDQLEAQRRRGRDRVPTPPPARPGSES